MENEQNYAIINRIFNSIKLNLVGQYLRCTLWSHLQVAPIVQEIVASWIEILSKGGYALGLDFNSTSSLGDKLWISSVVVVRIWISSVVVVRRSKNPLWKTTIPATKWSVSPWKRVLWYLVVACLNTASCGPDKTCESANWNYHVQPPWISKSFLLPKNARKMAFQAISQHKLLWNKPGLFG